MQCECRDQTYVGPSGIYRNPLIRDDSVIPGDTPNDRVGEQNNATLANSMILTFRSSLTSEPAGWQERRHRRELFKLLLSHLNSINQFSAESYDTEAEERMNLLLHHFWTNDTEHLQVRLGDNFARLHTAIESWMAMRHRLNEFRIATGYFGQPGESWEDHLKRMSNVPCAQASLAYVDLQEFASQRGGLNYVAETFDADLATLFDLLTMVKGCNGSEAFKGVGLYNAALVEWFRQDEDDG